MDEVSNVKKSGVVVLSFATRAFNAFAAVYCSYFERTLRWIPSIGRLSYGTVSS